MIDTDTRQLKRLSSGSYTTGAGKIICDHCGYADKCIVVPSANQCPMFLPAIPFQDEAGLDQPSNTVRIGVAWTKRLKVGQAIALYNVRTQEVFGLAEVVSMFSGQIDDVLEHHAANNHLMLDTPAAEAPALLKAWQRQNYGPRIVNDATKITAIYLQRIDVQDAAPRHQGDEARRTPEGCPARPGEDHGDGDGHAPDRH